MAYDAFISYSHGADARLASVLQAALQRFAKPWWKLRALDLFRDETGLAAASSLSGAILAALEESRFFIFLASPGAARSKWCRAELAHWLTRKSPETLLLVRTEGTIAWSDAAGDFDWAETDALPRDTLAGAFATEPFHLDLSWAKSADQFDAREPRFQSVVAKLAATLHGKSLEAIAGEELRQHRRTRRVTAAAVASIGLLALGASAAAVTAYQARQAAERNLADAMESAHTLVVEVASAVKDFRGVPLYRIEAILAKAEAIHARLDRPDAPDGLRHRRAVMLGAFVEAYLALGRTKEALARAEAMRRTMAGVAARDPGHDGKQRDLAVSHSHIGDVLSARNDDAGALAAYRRARDILAPLVARAPGEPAWQRDLGLAHERIGAILLDRNDFAGAQASLRARHAIAAALAQRDPGNELWERDLAMSHEGLGDLRRRQRDFDGAMAEYRARNRIIDRMAARGTRSTILLRDRMIGHALVADILFAQGDRRGALAERRKSLALAQELADGDRDNADYGRDLGLAQLKYGVVLAAVGEFDPALAALQAAIAALAPLAQRSPDDAGPLPDLFAAWAETGLIHLDRRDGAAAAKAFAAALPVIEKLIALQPGNPAWTRDRDWLRGRIEAAEAAARDAAE